MFNTKRRIVALAGGVTVFGAIWLGEHFALFAWLVASGLGVPPGEDILVATTGVLVAGGHLTWWVALPMAIVAVVTSDTLLFSGGQVARATLSGSAAWWTDRALRMVELLLGSRHAVAIIIGRFVPGLRTLAFLSVGAHGMSRARFLLIDACAATAWVPLAMTCGATVVSRLLGEDFLGRWV